LGGLGFFPAPKILIYLILVTFVKVECLAHSVSVALFASSDEFQVGDATLNIALSPFFLVEAFKLSNQMMMMMMMKSHRKIFYAIERF